MPGNKKVYSCGKCGRELIRRKLPFGWHRITKRNRKGERVFAYYVCSDCHIGW